MQLRLPGQAVEELGDRAARSDPPDRSATGAATTSTDLDWSVNQRLPSGPAVISTGRLPVSRPAENSVIVPLGVIRPIAAGAVAGPLVPWR